MELFQLEQFAAIAASKTMREAAERLYLSQPALSQNLKKLESELGCTLFDRAHNGLRITSYGEILLDHAHRIMFDLAELRDEIERQKRLDAETVRVGCFSIVVATFSMPQVAGMFPEYRFDCVVTTSRALRDGLRRGEFDLCVLPERDVPEEGVAVPLFREELLLSVPSSSPAARREKAKLEDLRGLDLLVPDGLVGMTEWYDAALAAAGVDPGRVERAPREDYLLMIDETPRAHFTTSFVADFVRDPWMRSAVPIDDPIARRGIYAVGRPGDERLDRILETVDREGIRLAAGHAFLPYLMDPQRAKNLSIRS